MKTLHLDLKLAEGNYVELRYFFDNPNQYEKRSLPLGEIADLIQLAEQDYYVRLAVNYTITGRKLYNWLDGSDRFLSRAMQQHPGESFVLAIAAAESLAHLPWEVLHDGNTFLVARMPAVVPVRWVSSDTKKLTLEGEPANRALNVLFMATSPLGVEPVLDFEAEEGRILEATARQPLALVVEESGCLTELGYLIDDYGKGYFDVLHLTGHATITDNGPRFNTETETGELYLASAADIAEKLQFRLPQLIFLSGCRTGQGGKSGAVPCLAEELLKLGAKAVLGWGQKVLDTDATAAAGALYGALAAGYELTEALSRTYQALIKQQAGDWHLLRLYVAGTLPGQLVTTLRTPGRKRAPKPSVAERFLDPAGKVKVPTRGSFVGRRRQLQNCLRALRGVAPLTPQPWGGQEEGQNLTPPSFGGPGGQCVGVLIHGMGGLGKSSLAARLCDRLPEFERIVWVGRVDEPSLVNKLGAALDSRELREALQDDKEELKFRLRRVFRQLEDPPDLLTKAPAYQGGSSKPFLLVLDNFEANLEPRDGGYVLQPEAVTVLEALVWAIGETYARHRLILTCPYDFESTLLQDFYKQPMDGLRGADLRKKCNRLSAFDAKSQVDEALQSQARRLADGNPRLLEWLNKVLLNLDPPQPPLKRGEQNTVAEILARLEVDPVELREQVLAEALLAQIDKPLEEMLQRGLVFELPVPREAIAAVCESIPNLEQQINRAVALGLLEVSPDSSLRVPRIMPLKLPEDAESLHKQAAEVLYRFWLEEAERTTEEKLLEIHQLALHGKTEKIAVTIAKIVTNRWFSRGQFREAIKICKDTLEVVKEYDILNRLAYAEQHVCEVDKALKHYQQALNLCPSEDEKGKAAILHNLASLRERDGRIKEAEALYQQAVEIDERLGNLKGKIQAWIALGLLKSSLGNFEETIPPLQELLELTKGISDIEEKAAVLFQLARLAANTRKIEEAMHIFQEALKINEKTDNIYSIAMILQWMGGLTADVKQNFNTGLNYLQRSLNILQNIQSLEAQREADKVIQIIARVQWMRDNGNVQEKTETLFQQGMLKAKSGEIEEAITLFQQLQEIHKLIGNVKDEALALAMLGQLLLNKGEFKIARYYLQQSLDIFQRFQIPGAETEKQAIARVQQMRDDIS